MANGTRKDSPFELWAEGEGIPVVRGYAVEDLLAVPVETWKRKEGKGAIIILQGGQGFNPARSNPHAPAPPVRGADLRSQGKGGNGILE